MFIRKSQLKSYVDKKSDIKSEDKIKLVKKEKNKIIKNLSGERDKAVNDTVSFFNIYRPIPAQIDSIWKDIAEYNLINLDEAAKKEARSNKIQCKLNSLIRTMNKMDIDYQKFIDTHEN